MEGSMKKDVEMFQSKRLFLYPLSRNDDAFIFELVNTEGWLRNIGDKNIQSIKDAKNYIDKIMAGNATDYWVVQLKDSKTKIGLITCIKRDYLKHRDIGFAFLPAYHKMGYAYEAAQTVLEKITQQDAQLTGITIPENKPSIHLLEKLGFSYNEEIVVDNEKLCVYKIDANKSH